jgi:hypothetical protein
MTKKQRAQVVELLRCAADIRITGTMIPRARAAYLLGTPERTQRLAEDAWTAVLNDVGMSLYQYELLEAAARVEEGSWP